MKNIVFIALAATLSVSVKAQQKFRFWSDTSKNVRKIVLPVIVYTPETHVGAGILGVRLWKNLHQTLETRTSNAELLAMYTSKLQVILIPRYTIFTKGEKYLFEGFGEELIGFRDYYFGRGNETPSSNREKIIYDALGWENRVGRKIFRKKKLFVGMEMRALQYYNVRKRNPPYLLDSTKASGYKGSSSIGLGPALTWDNRDNVVNPGKGFYLDVRYSTYSKSMGGTVNYHRIYVDARKYFNVNQLHRHILAFELFGNFVRGDAPFKELAELGGPRIMRGYYRGRYRDNYITAFQAEYRLPLHRRIGMVAFAGLGKVYNPTQVDMKGLHYSYGTGLRVKINQREKLNLRMDYALGDLDHPGYFYLGFAESF